MVPTDAGSVAQASGVDSCKKPPILTPGCLPCGSWGELLLYVCGV